MGATSAAPGCASFFRVVVVNGLRDDITCGIQAGNLRQRGLRPLVGDQCRQLLRLRIVFATEMHRRRNPFHQVAVRQPVFQCTQQRLN